MSLGGAWFYCTTAQVRTLFKIYSQSFKMQLDLDDETTDKELASTLNQVDCNLTIFAVTALKARRMWRGTAYCQLICAPNRITRLEWARKNLGEHFQNVIWTDETSVQMETHHHFHCYTHGQKLDQNKSA